MKRLGLCTICLLWILSGCMAPARPRLEPPVPEAVGATILDKYLEFRYKDETRNFVPKEILSHFGQEFSVKEASVYLA